MLAAAARCWRLDRLLQAPHSPDARRSTPWNLDRRPARLVDTIAMPCMHLKVRLLPVQSGGSGRLSPVGRPAARAAPARHRTVDRFAPRLPTGSAWRDWLGSAHPRGAPFDLRTR